MRWWEEVHLLREEMRRSVEFCRWKSRWWRDLAQDAYPRVTSEIREGARAYAFSHENAEAQLADRWYQKWDPLIVKADEFIQEHPALDPDNNVIAGPNNDNEDGAL